MSLLHLVGGSDSITTDPFMFEGKAEPARGILVVDDEELIRTFLGLFFRQQGLRFWLAESGAEALDIFRCHGDEIGLVLLDVRMPEMDGPHTFSCLKELNQDLACYFMSGHWEPYSEVSLMRMGAAGLILKPFLVKLLSNIVHQCLSKS